MLHEEKSTVQRRSICTLTGIAVGFRVFYAVVVDGAQMFSSGWIAVLLAMLAALPAAAALVMLRRTDPQQSAVSILKNVAGAWGARLIGLILFVVLLYDSAAVLRLMSAAAKYVAMPEGNRVMIIGITAFAAVLAALLGVPAASNAAVLWKKLLLVLIGILIVTQLRYFQGAWLFPLLGTGIDAIVQEAVPMAGMFCFIVCGWLMMEPAHDQSGMAMTKILVHTAAAAAGAALLFAMLIPGMIDEPPGRSFRIGRLLMNDRAGLSLEMPYVVLIYGGMLTMLIFELSAAAAALKLCFDGLKRNVCVMAAGVLGFAAAASGFAEREMLKSISMWYYPMIALPMMIIGIKALMQVRRKSRAAGGGGNA